MINEVTFTLACSCDSCAKTIVTNEDYDGVNIYCDDCYVITKEDVKDALIEAANNAQDYTPQLDHPEPFEGFANQKELDIFCHGLYSGFHSALFWTADAFALVKYFEDVITPQLENNRRK